MASSHQHSGDDSFHNNYYEGNNFFPNLDPSLIDSHDAASDQTWAIQPSQLSVARGFQSSERQQWQNTQPLSNESHATSYMNQNGQFGTAYNSVPSQFQNQHAPQNHYGAYQQSPYDMPFLSPSTTTGSRSGLPSTGMLSTAPQTTTVAPEALQNPPTPSTASQPQQPVNAVLVASNLPLPQIPQGIANGNYLVIDSNSLSAAAASRRMHNFVDVGDSPYDVVITKSTIPVYVSRKSRNEIKQMLATDSRLSAKISQKISKHGRASVPKAVARTNSTDNTTAKRSVSLSDGSSSEESSDESDYESSEDEAEKSPLPKVRPTSAVESVKYDCIKALWRPRSRPASGDDIRDGLKQFWELFQSVRDRWKSDAADVKQAEDSKKNHEIPLLKERVAKQREMAEASLRAALDHGHPDIVEHFGEYLPFMGSLAVFLAERAREGEYSGSFALTILEFISRCKTLTEGNLEKTNIAKVLLRYTKRGDKAAQTFSKRITDNAALASRKRKETTKPASPAIPIKDVKDSTNGVKNGVVVAGVKRRVGDVSNDQPLKKIANSTATIASKPAVAIKKTVTESKAPALATKQVIAKPTSFFSGLQSAAKKPGTSNAAIAAALSKPVSDTSAEKKPLVTSTSAAQTKAPATPAFSFAATMANLTKPKEVEPVTKNEEAGPPETAAERTKRLRKEERRKLRVSWRPEESLVAIKYFMHDPEEELGHDASQVRDVGDIGSEGRMLKEHRDQMDVEDEDEDSNKLMEKAWRDPVLIDFSDIGEEEQARNYAPYGGGMLKPESLEHEVQERREANTLTAFYSSSADVPLTPKEAPAATAASTAAVKEFGLPPAQILERLAEIAAAHKPVAPTATTNSGASFDLQTINAILGAYNNQATSQAPASATVPAPQNDLQMSAKSDLESIFAKFAAPAAIQQPLPPPPPPQTQHVPPPFSFGGLPPQTPQAYSQVPAALSNDPAISSLLASLQGSLQPISSAQPQVAQGMAMMPLVPQMPPMPVGVPDYSQQYAQYAWMQQMYAQQAAQVQQQQQQTQGYPYENEERRRWREGGGANMGGHDGNDDTNDVNGFNKRQMKQQQQQGMQQGPLPKKRPGHPPMFVVQCKYFNEGKCKKGADCTFRHDVL